MSHFPHIESGTADRLVQAATHLFWERSFASVSVSEICDRAMVCKGSFYYFFSSKSALLLAALETERQHDRSILDQIFATEGSPRVRLQRLCQKGYEIQRRKRAECGRVCGWFSGVVGSELACRDEQARCEVVKTIGEIVDRIDRSIIFPMCDSHKSRQLASMIFGYIQGCLLEARIRNDLQPVHNMAHDIRAFSPNLLGTK
ncbi:hypothetical protein BH09VER1_BH09VER1_29360 [soil metagenome]